MDTDLEPFARLLTRHQSRLWAFVFARVAEPELARDVFQDTNRVLWERAAEFDREREFLPWAFGIARKQALAARRARGRERLAFGEAAVERIADRASERLARHDARQVALAECLERLPGEDRELVRRRYDDGDSVQALARELGRTASALGVALFRIRRALARCIEGREATA